VQSIAISADGQRLATGSSNKTVCVWDLRMVKPAARTLTLEPPKPKGGRRFSSRASVVMSRDGRWLVSSVFGAEQVELWDLSAEDPATARHVLRGRGGRVTVFSPDSRRLVTADRGIATLWDLIGGATRPVAHPLHGNVVHDAAAFSADGRWLATTGLRGTTLVWDLSGPDPAGMPIALPGHQGSVRAVAFTADGRRLMTGGDDTTVRVWEVSLDRLIEQARRRAGRPLTRQERVANRLPAASKGR
jgi:WD40 repeat protein